MTQDVDGSIGSFAVEPAKVVMCGCTTACFWLDEICGIRRDFEDHIACIVSEDAVWICLEVVHEHGGSGDGVGWWGGLFRCNFIECWENTGVTCAAIIHEGAIDSLDSGSALLVEKLGFGV